MEDFREIGDILLRYLRNELDPGEEKVLEEWMGRDEKNREFVRELSDNEELRGKIKAFHVIEKERKPGAREELFSRIARQPKVVTLISRKWVGWVAAASVIGIVLAGIGLYRSKGGTANSSLVSQHAKPDIVAGHEGAILTLADGRSIVLDSAQNGKITDVAVKNGNEIEYRNSGRTSIESNTMSTPKGRQFSVVLPDGTRVWLNAASSITYPTAFAGNERRVSITGEAYFEVAPDAVKSFDVYAGGMDVQVLGTHFNINAYRDEGSIKTTLLQGSIKVTSAGKAQLVRPGEETIITADRQIRLSRDVDVDAAVAWKNGFFQFGDASLRQVMRQLERWYDVEVVYEGNVPDKVFEGRISRQANLSQVLKILQESGIHFEITERKLLIKP